MKRFIVSLFLVTLMCFGGFVFAQEFKNGLSSGGFCVIENNFGQGYGEWNFPIVSAKNGFILRDCVTVGGFGKAEEGNKISMAGFTIGDKLILGGMHTAECFRVRTYGLLGVDFSMFTAKGHSLFSPSVIMATLVGGGFEFQYSKSNAFVVEYGGKYRYVIGKDMKELSIYNYINPVISFGYRSYY